jgi:hypothetical protein
MKRMPEDLYDGPIFRITINKERRVHRLMDEGDEKRRTPKIAIRRDPLVEALFGAPQPKMKALIG